MFINISKNKSVRNSKTNVQYEHNKRLHVKGVVAGSSKSKMYRQKQQSDAQQLRSEIQVDLWNNKNILTKVVENGI